MSATINMKLTTAGRAAIFNAQGTGVQAVLSHVQIGTGRRTPDGSETAMITPVQTTTIAAGSKPSPTQIRVSCLFPGISNYDMTEIGVWIGNPAAGGVLFAYYSVTTGKIGTMVSGTDFVFAHEWTMDAADAAALTILADTGQSAMLAMMAAHEAAGDPHPQYATDAQLAGLVGTSSPTMNGVAAVGVATKYSREDHRHPSDSSKASKTGDTFSGNVTINMGALEAAFVAQGGSSPYAAFMSGPQWWGLWSSAGGQLVHYDRATGKKYFAGIDSEAVVQNNGSTYGINVTGSSAYAASAGNADTVDGMHAADLRAWNNLTGRPTTIAGYGITDALVYNNGGTYGINISGNSTYATNAGYASSADTANKLAASPGTAPHYALRTWVNFNGVGSVYIRNAGNVSSITDLGTGQYRLNFSAAMPHNTYAAAGNTSDVDGENSFARPHSVHSKTVWSCDVHTRVMSSGNYTDVAICDITITC